MKTNPSIILILILAFLISCKPAFTNTSKKISYEGGKEDINLYAFIGKKISVTEFDPNENQEKNQKIEQNIDEETGDTVTVYQKRYIMDNGFRCKYKIIKKLFNYIKTDTIEFLAYDHYGTPGFAQKDTVILYLSKSNEDSHFFHQKYQFDSVFKNKDGNYFSYPKFISSENQADGIGLLKGFPIDFLSEKFDVSYLDIEAREKYYPKEFYKIENNIAVPIKGINLRQLIDYRLQTTFKDL